MLATDTKSAQTRPQGAQLYISVSFSAPAKWSWVSVQLYTLQYERVGFRGMKSKIQIRWFMHNPKKWKWLQIGTQVLWTILSIVALAVFRLLFSSSRKMALNLHKMVIFGHFWVPHSFLYNFPKWNRTNFSFGMLKSLHVAYQAPTRNF